MTIETKLEEIKQQAVPLLITAIRDCEEAGVGLDTDCFEEYDSPLCYCNIEFDASMDVLRTMTNLTEFFKNVMVNVEVSYDECENGYDEEDDYDEEDEDYNDSMVEESITVTYSIKQRQYYNEQ